MLWLYFPVNVLQMASMSFNAQYATYVYLLIGLGDMAEKWIAALYCSEHALVQSEF